MSWKPGTPIENATDEEDARELIRRLLNDIEMFNEAENPSPRRHAHDVAATDSATIADAIDALKEYRGRK